MKVLLVNSLMPPEGFGGAEQFCQNLATNLMSRNCAVKVLCTTNNPDLFQDSNLEVTNFNPRTGVFIKDLSRSSIISRQWFRATEYMPFVRPIFPFKEIVKVFNPDIIHYNNLWGISPDILEYEGNAKKIATFHDYAPICPRGTLLHGNGTVCEKPGYLCRAHANFYSKKYRDFDVIVSPSEFLLDKVTKAGTFGKKCIKISNSAYFPKRNTVADYVPIVGYIGQFEKHKGVHNLITAIRQCGSLGLKFVFAGSGSLLPEVLRLESECENVSYVGVVEKEEKLNFFEKCGLIILPSCWNENAPISILEALGQGRPVSTTKLGGLLEYATEDVNFIIDGIGSEHILRVLFDYAQCSSDTYRKYSINALSRCETFSVDNMVDSYMSLYASI